MTSSGHICIPYEVHFDTSLVPERDVSRNAVHPHMQERPSSNALEGLLRLGNRQLVGGRHEVDHEEATAEG